MPTTATTPASPEVSLPAYYWRLASATDAAGNVGTATAPFNLTVDTGVPSAPVISTAGDNVGSIQTPLSSGQSTDDTTPTLNGTATANATVTVYENGQPVGTVGR